MFRRHIGYRIYKRKFSHCFAKCKLEIGEQCRTAVRAMGVMGVPMSGQLREGEIAPMLESFGALRKGENAIFWP